MPAVFQSLFGHSEVLIYLNGRIQTLTTFGNKYWPQPTQPCLAEQTIQAFGGNVLDVVDDNLLHDVINGDPIQGMCKLSSLEKRKRPSPFFTRLQYKHTRHTQYRLTTLKSLTNKG